MALRVLLADESVTIKKVFQLSLQDYGVDVTTVNVGLDVLQIAQKLKPDIIFVDVLLQKKNGYEVCADLKADSHLANTPVVLIWSGFMELDEAKFKQCQADSHLEKPFDTDKLRSLIQSLVPKTQSQSLSRYLDFPDMPEFEEATPEHPPVSPMETPQAPPEEAPDETSEEWSMESFAPLQPPPPPLEVVGEKDSGTEDEEEGSEWVSKTLTHYKMDKKALLEEPELSFEVPEEKIDPDTLIGNQTPPPLSADVDVDESEEIELEIQPAQETGVETRGSLTEKQIEAIVRAEARQMIEQVVWEVVPEIATQIIEREIKRIIKENDERNL